MTAFWIGKLVSAAMILVVWWLAVRQYRRSTAAATRDAVAGLEAFATRPAPDAISPPPFDESAPQGEPVRAAV